MRTVVLVWFMLNWLLPGPEASAHEIERSRWTFGATAGGGRTWDDEGSIGSGWLAGGYADRRISAYADVEIAIDVLRHRRNTGPFGFQAEGHTTYLSAAVVRRFGTPSANFFLLGGGTIGIHSGTAGLGDSPSPPNETDSRNVGVIFGGGASFRASGNIEIAPLVRMTLMRASDDSDPFSSIMVGVRVGVGR